MGFCKNSKILSIRESLENILEADLAALNIHNQKNGRMGEKLHQESTGTKGALKYIEHRVHHIIIKGGTDDNLLCDVCYNVSWTEVTSRYIFFAVITSSKALKL